MIDQRNLHIERRRVGHIPLDALFFIVFWIFEIGLQAEFPRLGMIAREIKRQVAVETLNGIDLVEELQQPAPIEEVFKGLQLNVNEGRQLLNFRRASVILDIIIVLQGAAPWMISGLGRISDSTAAIQLHEMCELATAQDNTRPTRTVHMTSNHAPDKL